MIFPTSRLVGYVSTFPGGTPVHPPKLTAGQCTAKFWALKDSPFGWSKAESAKYGTICAYQRMLTTVPETNNSHLNSWKTIVSYLGSWPFFSGFFCFFVWGGTASKAGHLVQAFAKKPIVFFWGRRVSHHEMRTSSRFKVIRIDQSWEKSCGFMKLASWLYETVSHIRMKKLEKT